MSPKHILACDKSRICRICSCILTQVLCFFDLNQYQRDGMHPMRFVATGSLPPSAPISLSLCKLGMHDMSITVNSSCWPQRSCTAQARAIHWVANNTASLHTWSVLLSICQFVFIASAALPSFPAPYRSCCVYSASSHPAVQRSPPMRMQSGCASVPRMQPGCRACSRQVLSCRDSPQMCRLSCHC